MRQPRFERLTVLTPEGIEFSFPLAGTLERFLAWLVDAAVIFAVISALGIPMAALGALSADIGRAAKILAVFSISIGYRIYAEWRFGGQTIGKRLLRLRVLDAGGLHLGFSQVVIRNLLRFVDSLPLFYMVGGLALLIGSRGQRLGDLAANTIVVSSPPAFEPDLGQLMQGKYNSFTGYPHLVARLRQRASPQLARIALSALLRRESLDPGARVDLFNAIAGHFRELVAFPPEVVEGMSDERYVRNCVDVLYQNGDPPRAPLAFARDSAVKPGS